MKKQVYVAPATMSVEMELEGIILSQSDPMSVINEAVSSEDGFAVREEQSWPSHSSVMDNEW